MKRRLYQVMIRSVGVELTPQFQTHATIQGMAKHFSPFKRAEDAEHLFDGFRKAGLPEN